jgi:hypothetical protein
VTATYGCFIDWDDSGTYAGSGEDVTTRVDASRGVSMERGRDQIRALGKPMAGRLEFALLNTSRDYSTENTGSPRYAQLRPGHRVRVTADNGTPYTLATCLLDDIAQEPALGVRSVRIPCLGMLSRLAGKRVTTGVYEGITTDVAIGAILDAVGWPAGERALGPGQTILQWWWLEEVDAFEALRTLLNTEGPGAAIYERGDGYLVFENRHYRALTTRSTTSQGTFRDSGAGPWHREPFSLNPNLKGVINRAEIAVNVRAPQPLDVIWELGSTLVLAASATIKLAIKAASDDPFRNAVAPVAGTDYTLLAGSATLTLDRTSGRSATLTVAAGAGGATITALRLRAQALTATTVRVVNVTDTSASQAKYGVRTWAEPVWPEIDIYLAQELCNAIVQSYQEPRATATITVEGADATMLGHCLSREISDRVTVVEAQTGLNTAMYIEQIRHEIGVGNRHVTTLGLEKVVAGTLPGVWDSATWNTSVWGY